MPGRRGGVSTEGSPIPNGSFDSTVTVADAMGPEGPSTTTTSVRRRLGTCAGSTGFEPESSVRSFAPASAARGGGASVRTRVPSEVRAGATLDSGRRAQSVATAVTTAKRPALSTPREMATVPPPGDGQYATFRLAHRRAPGTLRRSCNPAIRSCSGASIAGGFASRCLSTSWPRTRGASSSIVAPGARGEPFGGTPTGSTSIGGWVGIRRRTSCGRARTCCCWSVRASRTRSSSSGTSPGRFSGGT